MRRGLKGNMSSTEYLLTETNWNIANTLFCGFCVCFSVCVAAC